MARKVRNLPAMWETQVRSLSRERSPVEGNGNPLQYSCLENPMDKRGAGRATVRGVTKSRTRLGHKQSPSCHCYHHVGSAEAQLSQPSWWVGGSRHPGHITQTQTHRPRRECVGTQCLSPLIQTGKLRHRGHVTCSRSQSLAEAEKGPQLAL